MSGCSNLSHFAAGRRCYTPVSPKLRFRFSDANHGGPQGAFEHCAQETMATVDVSPVIRSVEKQSLASRWRDEPSSAELFGLVTVTGFLFVLFICFFQPYSAQVYQFGDSASYMTIASAIRHWDFRGLVVEHFWGLPYGIALVSSVTHLSELKVLLAICVASSFASVIMAGRLWGGWVAGFFAVLGFDWMQRSFLGGSEPPFVALTFASFLAVRRERWLLATVLASLATVTRPQGLFILIAIGLILLVRREFVKCVLAIVISLAIGAAYSFPLAHYFGNPLANLRGYDPSGNLFGIPFYAIIKGTILYPAPWTNLIFTFGWIAIVTAACILMATSREYRSYAGRFPVEAIFAALFLLSVYCYNYPYWARGSFPRFIVPALPFVLLALFRWIPKDRRLLWALGFITPLLAAASAIGVLNVALRIRSMF